MTFFVPLCLRVFVFNNFKHIFIEVNCSLVYYKFHVIFNNRSRITDATSSSTSLAMVPLSDSSSSAMVPISDSSSSALWSHYSKYGDEPAVVGDIENKTSLAEKTQDVADSVKKYTADCKTNQQVYDFFKNKMNVKKLAFRLYLNLTSKDKDTKKSATKLKNALEELADSLPYNKDFHEADKTSGAVLSVLKKVEKLDKKSSGDISKISSKLFPNGLPSSMPLLPREIFRNILKFVKPKELFKIMSVSKEAIRQSFNPSKEIIIDKIAENATFRDFGFASLDELSNYLKSKDFVRGKSVIPVSNLESDTLSIPKLPFNDLLKCVKLREKLSSSQQHMDRIKSSKQLTDKIQQLTDRIKMPSRFPPEFFISQINENEREFPSFYALNFSHLGDIYDHFGSHLAKLEIYNSYSVKGAPCEEWRNIGSLKSVKSICSPYLRLFISQPECISFLKTLGHLEHIKTTIVPLDDISNLRELELLKFLKLQINNSYEPWELLGCLENLGKCLQLERVDIDFFRHPEFNADLLSQLENMKKLRCLSLSRCILPLNGRFLRQLAKMKNIKELCFENCEFNMADIKHLVQQLKTIKVVCNKSTEVIYDEVQKCAVFKRAKNGKSGITK